MIDGRTIQEDRGITRKIYAELDGIAMEKADEYA